MRGGHVEELLEVYFPLRSAVSSYRCPPMDSCGGRSASPGGGNPDADRTLVIDVSLAIDALSTATQNVLACLYGARMSLRGTARKLKSHPEEVKRRRDGGIAKLRLELERRGVKMSRRQKERYLD